MTMTRRDALKQTALLGAASVLAPRILAASPDTSGSAPGNRLVLPDLPYAPNALEPAIDAQTMRIHHGRHHAGYVTKYNKALDEIPGEPLLEEVLARLEDVPGSVRTSVRNNGGGAYNHALFWESMAPIGQGGAPTGELAARLNRDFGSVGAFQQVFSEQAGSVFGSGWAWLILRKSDDKLVVTSTANQDNPLMTGVVPEAEQGTPLFGLDVWEHAYYLHYQNRRGDYISNWWQVANWDKIADRLP
jgi:Fe-Mn family superoxide dismutase